MANQQRDQEQKERKSGKDAYKRVDITHIISLYLALGQ